MVSKFVKKNATEMYYEEIRFLILYNSNIFYNVTTLKYRN